MLTLAAPVLALVLRGRVGAEIKAEAKEQAPLAVDRVAALVGPKLDELIDGFGARLLEFVAQAGDALARGSPTCWIRPCAIAAAEHEQAATADAKRIDASFAEPARGSTERIADVRQGVWSRTAMARTRRPTADRPMGILDRIAARSTTDPRRRTRQQRPGGDRARRRSPKRATWTAPRRRCGRCAARSRATRRVPRARRLEARRGALDDAVTALGAPSISTGATPAWCALGEALARLGRAEPARTRSAAR